MTTLVAGWAVPDNETTAHYFVEGVSLCRLWKSSGATTPTPHPMDTHCRTCAERARR